jgi:hypothetical protein
MPVIGLITSTVLEFVSLWQIEIATGWSDETFEFPFFSLAVNKWWARDFWYAINIVAWVLAIISGSLFYSAVYP